MIDRTRTALLILFLYGGMQARLILSGWGQASKRFVIRFQRWGACVPGGCVPPPSAPAPAPPPSSGSPARASAEEEILEEGEWGDGSVRTTWMTGRPFPPSMPASEEPKGTGGNPSQQSIHGPRRSAGRRSNGSYAHVYRKTDTQPCPRGHAFIRSDRRGRTRPEGAGGMHAHMPRTELPCSAMAAPVSADSARMPVVIVRRIVVLV